MGVTPKPIKNAYQVHYKETSVGEALDDITDIVADTIGLSPVLTVSNDGGGHSIVNVSALGTALLPVATTYTEQIVGKDNVVIVPNMDNPTHTSAVLVADDSIAIGNFDLSGASPNPKMPFFMITYNNPNVHIGNRAGIFMKDGLGNWIPIASVTDNGHIQLVSTLLHTLDINIEDIDDDIAWDVPNYDCQLVGASGTPAAGHVPLYDGTTDKWVSTYVQWKSSVATVGNLPSTGNTTNDIRMVVADKKLYMWSGTAWVTATDAGITEGEHATIHEDAEFNDALAISADVGGNETIADHMADESIHNVPHVVTAYGHTDLLPQNLTTSYVAVSNGVTLNKKGTYKISAWIQVDFDNVTTSEATSVSLGLYRNNNTPSGILYSAITPYTGVITSTNGTFIATSLPTIYYTTSNTNDVLEIRGNTSGNLGGGNLKVTEAWIAAEKIG